jgi:amino acid transporter
VAGVVLLWFAWNRISGEFRLFEARAVIDGAQNLAYAAIALVLLGSVFLVAIDAARLGFGKDSVPATSSAKHGPLAWAFFLLLLWVVAFPAYFHARLSLAPKARRLTGVAVALALLFTGAAIGVNWVISERTTDVQQHFQTIQRNADDARRQLEEAQGDLQRRLGQ